MINIINKTIEILSANSEWQERYKGYLKDIWNNSVKTNKGFRKPSGLSVYTTVAGRNTKNYYLRFKGQTVGEVIVSKKGDTSLTYLVQESHDINGCPLPVPWHSAEATQFRAFFSDLAKNELSADIAIKSPEHEVENALLVEFRKRGGDAKVLRYIQPVLLHGNYFQMPTPLKASRHDPEYAGHRGGGIDILARIKTSDGHSRLCVIEIKDENKAEESQKDAMSQAIIYATFVAKLLTKQPDWMEFFMGHNKKRNINKASLDKYDIAVVTIMPKGNTDTFENKILEIPGTNFKLHCHSLFYDKEKFSEDRSFQFSGTFLSEIRK